MIPAKLLSAIISCIPPLSHDKYKGQAGRIGVIGGSIEWVCRHRHECVQFHTHLKRSHLGFVQVMWSRRSKYEGLASFPDIMTFSTTELEQTTAPILYPIQFNLMVSNKVHREFLSRNHNTWQFYVLEIMAVMPILKPIIYIQNWKNNILNLLTLHEIRMINICVAFTDILVLHTMLAYLPWNVWVFSVGLIIINNIHAYENPKTVKFTSASVVKITHTLRSQQVSLKGCTAFYCTAFLLWNQQEVFIML